jgi:aminopeptidase N
MLGHAKGQLGDNPQAKMMISQMLKDGLSKKWNF